MRLFFPGLFTGLTLSFAWLWYVRYWKWRDCIAAAESSCVLPDGDNLTGGGMAWGVFAVAFALAAFVSWLFSRPDR